MTLKRSLVWMSGAQLIAGVVQFASSVVLARLLTPYETGIYAVALAAIGFLSIIQSMGLQALIIREQTVTPSLAATAFTVNAVVAALLALATLGTSLVAPFLFGDPAVGRILLFLAPLPLLGIFLFLPSSQIERRGRFRVIALCATTTAVVSASATMVFAFAGYSYMSVAYGQWTGALANLSLLLWIGRTHVSYRLGFTEWRRVADFGFQMLAVSGVTGASTRLADLILARVIGLSSLGFFSRAVGVNNLVWGNIHLVVGRVLLVDFAELHRKKVSLRDRYINTVEISTAVLWPAFAGLALLSHQLVYHVYGEAWLRAATLVSFIAIGSMIQVAITMTWELFAATGELRTQTKIETLRAAISLVLFFGACLISLEAAAATRVIDAIIAVVLYRPHLNRMTDTQTRDFWPAYSRSAILTLLAIAPAGLLMAFDPADFLSLTGLLGSIGLGGLAWASGLAAMRHPISREVWGSVQAFVR